MSISPVQDRHMSTLRYAREDAGLSRERLARLAETSTSTITRMEREDHIPNAATVVRIASVLGTTAESLLSPGAVPDPGNQAVPTVDVPLVSRVDGGDISEGVAS